MLTLERAEKCEQVAASRGLRQIRRSPRLPTERRLELELFVRRIAIGVVATLGALDSRAYVRDIA